MHARESLCVRELKVRECLFEGVCLNSRHPGPRRVLGRYRAAVCGSDPVDPLDRLDPQMESFLRVLHIFLQQKWLGPHSGAMFFDFVMDLSCKTPTFESFFWKIAYDCLPEMLSKLDVLAERSMKKSENIER